MTIDEFMNIVWNLANKGYVRYWLHYPGNSKMMLQFRNGISLKSAKVDGMEEMGFSWNDAHEAYIIHRSEQTQGHKRIS